MASKRSTYMLVRCVPARITTEAYMYGKFAAFS